VFPESREQGFVEILDRVLHEGTPFIGREVRIEVHPPDGGPPDERFVDLTYVPRTEPDGTRSGVIAHGVDVTAHVHARRDVERLLGEYKQLAQREREAREAAEANARARDDVLAVVTHDLGSPLAAISTAAASLSDPTAPLTGAKASTVIAVIERAAGSMHRMIRDLLDVASIEAGRLALERRPERADHLVTRAVELAAATARDRSIALETRIAPDLPRVHADAERVMQALGNLVTNALKFTPPGGRVTLVVADDPQSDSRGDATGNPAAVRFTVADTGRGIPANELPNVFDPFWQRRGGASRRGTGLGLAIVRGIVEAHGGQLRAESTLGTGSAFSFTIPTVP
jgi:signal transduction histidine kinase